MTVWLIVAAASIGTALLTAIGNLATSEIQGRLELLPHAILWIAARWLSPDQRVSVYEEEWLPELIFILREADSLPLTRLALGLRYAVGVVIASQRVARQLIRSAQPTQLTTWTGAGEAIKLIAQRAGTAPPLTPRPGQRSVLIAESLRKSILPATPPPLDLSTRPSPSQDGWSRPLVRDWSPIPRVLISGTNRDRAETGPRPKRAWPGSRPSMQLSRMQTDEKQTTPFWLRPIRRGESSSPPRSPVLRNVEPSVPTWTPWSSTRRPIQWPEHSLPLKSPAPRNTEPPCPSWLQPVDLKSDVPQKSAPTPDEERPFPLWYFNEGCRS